MALWTSRNDDRLLVRRIAIVPWAFGLSLAAAMLVPAAFEYSDEYSSAETIKSGLQRAALILLFTAALGPWTSLRIDRRRRVVRCRRLWLFWPSSRQIEYETIRSVDPLKRPALGWCARNVVRFRTRSQSFAAPLGWSFGAAAQARVDRLAAEIERTILAPESASPTETAATELSQPRLRWQFSLRRLMFVTLAVAAVFGLARLAGANPDQTLLPGTIATTAMVAWSAIRYRWNQDAAERALLLLAVIYVPFAWIVEVSRPFGRTSGMWGVFLYFPNSFIAALFARSLAANAAWIAAAVTLVEFAALAYAVNRGWRATLAAAFVMGAASWWMSSILYAGYRM